MYRVARPRAVASFLTALLSLGLFLTSSAHAMQPAARTFTILQINDVYKVEGASTGGGLSRVRELRRQLENANGHNSVLVMHAGDIFFPSLMSSKFEGKKMLEVLNRLDGSETAFDNFLVATLGNHEFDPKRSEWLRYLLQHSQFRWVSSNVKLKPEAAQTAPLPVLPPTLALDWATHAPTQATYHIYPHLLVTMGEGNKAIKVGIVGVTTDMGSRPYVDYLFRQNDYADLYARVRLELAALKLAGAEVFIALTHQSMAEDKALAAAIPQIDHIVGGHEHFNQRERVNVGGTAPAVGTGTGGKFVFITKADADALTAFQIDISVPLATVPPGPTGYKPQVTMRLIPLDPKSWIKPDATLQHTIDSYRAETLAAIKTDYPPDLDYGTATHPLDGFEDDVRSKETALGDFLTDVIRTSTQAEMAIVNGGSIRINDTIPAGKITNEHLASLFVFGTDKLVKMRLTGAQLLELLRTSVKDVDSGHGRFLQISGFKFKYKNHSDPAKRVLLADVKLANGTPIVANNNYVVATTSFMYKAGKGDGYTILDEGAPATFPPAVAQDPQPDYRASVETTLRGHTIDVQVTDRIQCIAPVPHAPDHEQRRCPGPPPSYERPEGLERTPIKPASHHVP